MADIDDIVAVVRAEVAKYVNGEFTDTDDFLRDLGLPSDDLTAIALSLEKRFDVRLDRREYRRISNVLSFAKALQSAGLPRRR